MKKSETVVAAVFAGTALATTSWYALADQPVGNGAVTISRVSGTQNHLKQSEANAESTGPIALARDAKS